MSRIGKINQQGKMCPLLFHFGAGVCRKEECWWYLEEVEQCAITVMAKNNYFDHLRKDENDKSE